MYPRFPSPSSLKHETIYRFVQKYLTPRFLIKCADRAYHLHTSLDEKVRWIEFLGQNCEFPTNYLVIDFPSVFNSVPSTTSQCILSQRVVQHEQIQVLEHIFLVIEKIQSSVHGVDPLLEHIVDVQVRRHFDLSMGSKTVNTLVIDISPPYPLLWLQNIFCFPVPLQK